MGLMVRWRKSRSPRSRRLLPAFLTTTFLVLVAPWCLPGAPPEGFSASVGPGELEWVGAIHGPRDVVGPGSWFKRALKAIAGIEDRRQGMLFPHGVAVDSQGRLLVADTKARVVHVFDPARRQYRQLRSPDSNPMAAPVDVATDRQGRIYVTDAVRSRLFVFSAKGKFLRTLGDVGRVESIFERATGVAIDQERERLYVVDTSAMRVVVLSLEGKILGRFGRRGGGPGEFNFPTHISVAADGTLWVTDALNFRVQRFTPAGEFLSAFGNHGADLGDFDKAKGVAADRDGNLFVVEGRNDRVQVFDAEGRFRFAFGVTGSRPGEFFLPSGIAVGPDDQIYVADTFNRRVQIFRYHPNRAPAAGGN